MILVHSERLVDLLKKHEVESSFVEHYNKYTTNTNLGYKEKGKVLWVGAYEHVPFIVDYFEKNDLGLEVDLLTSPDKGQSLAEAQKRYKRLGYSGAIKKHLRSRKNLRLLPWDENSQKRLMEETKAGIDIKNVLLWGQAYKPPTKAQQFISSGIPFACNKESYSYEYFLKRGFELAEPVDIDKWFSRKYWQETNSFKDILNEAISLTAVGRMYQKSLDLIL